MYDPIARTLFSLYGVSRDVVRNTHVTPKLIRATTLPAASLSLFPSFSSSCQPGCAFPLPRLRTSQHPRSLVIGFSRFSQLFLKSLATLFSRFVHLFLSTARAHRVASTTATGGLAPFVEQSVDEWEPPLILFSQTLRSRYFVAKDRSRDLKSSIALLP